MNSIKIIINNSLNFHSELLKDVRDAVWNNLPFTPRNFYILQILKNYQNRAFAFNY